MKKNNKDIPRHIVIFVEGDTDELFFKALVEHYKKVSQILQLYFRVQVVVITGHFPAPAVTSPGLFFPTRRLEKNSPGLVSRISPACPRVPGLHAPGAMPFESAVRSPKSLKRYKSLCIVLSFTKVAVSLQPDKPYGSKSGSVAHFQGNPFPRPPIILQISPTCKFQNQLCTSRDRR